MAESAHMKLLHVTPTYWPAFRYGGPIWSVHALCKALVCQGHEVEVVTTNADGKGELDVPIDSVVDVDGVQVRYFPSKIGRRLFWSGEMISHLAKAVPQADFVHLQALFVWPSVAAARVARHAKVPYCVAPRGALVPELVARKSRVVKEGWLRLFGRRMIEGADFIHATSEAEAADAMRFGYDLPSVEVIPNGVDLPDVSGFSGLSEDLTRALGAGRLLLFLGRVSWKKGLDRLIPALAYVPGASLAVAGNDDEVLTPKLRALAEANGVADRVHFIGPVYGDAKTALLRRADLLVLPSYNENFGNVVLEALAVGRPVAVTAEVGLATVVADAGVGCVVPGEPEDMGRALAGMLDDPSLLLKMGCRGRVLVGERYAWDSVARSMAARYALAHRRG